MAQGFLPVTKKELLETGVSQPDFVYVVGDAYVDHPSFGAAIISRLQESQGYSVAMLPQPDWRDPSSVLEFGEPRLGFLVTGGNMGSMVNHYSVGRHRRRTDAYTPGGVTGKRPDYATVVYCNLIRRTYRRKPIIIEPKSAFGTGHHNTTVLCLEAITELLASGRLKAGQRFFDVGTGSGILGIACCLNGLAGLGSDIDPVAVDNALENVVINKVADDFRIVPGSAEAGEGEQFDLVVANILAGPLRELAPALIARMKPGACLVLSGLLDVQADAVEAAYAELGKARRVQSGDWVALVWGE